MFENRIRKYMDSQNYSSDANGSEPDENLHKLATTAKTGAACSAICTLAFASAFCTIPVVIAAAVIKCSFDCAFAGIVFTYVACIAVGGRITERA